jgi:hypothetical protein
MRADRREADADDTARECEAYRWSNFSHNVAGLIPRDERAALAGFVVGGGGPDSGRSASAARRLHRSGRRERGTWPFGPASLSQVSRGIQT